MIEYIFKTLNSRIYNFDSIKYARLYIIEYKVLIVLNILQTKKNTF